MTSATRRVTLAELGQRLSHGILQAGTWAGEYSFKRQSLELDLEIEEAVTTGDAANHPGLRVLKSLRASLVTLCGKDITKIPESEALILLGMLPYTDIFLLQYARFAARKPTVPTESPVKCPHCEKMIPAGTAIDVCRMAVDAFDPWKVRPTGTYEFAAPVDVEGMGATKVLTFEVPTWNQTLYPLTEEQMNRPLRSQYAYVEPAIVGTDKIPREQFVPGKAGWLARSLTDTTWPGLRDAVLGFCGGPRPAFPLRCPHCGKDVLFPFPYTALGLS